MHTDDIFIRTSVFADVFGSCNQQDTEWKDSRIKGGLGGCDGGRAKRGGAVGEACVREEQRRRAVKHNVRSRVSEATAPPSAHCDMSMTSGCGG